MSDNYIRKVAIVGAGGQVGTYIAEALLKTGKHQVTAISREGSTNKIPEGVEAKHVNYDDQASLVKAMEGQDCLIITMYARAPKEASQSLIKAAAEAKVPWVMPNEWGLDHLSEELAGETMIGGPILDNRKLVKDLGVSSYIAVVSGFWYEYSLSTSCFTYGFDFKNKKVALNDDGKTLFNTTTFTQTGRAVAALLSLPINHTNKDDKSPCVSDWKDNCLYISSYLVSQEDMLASVLRVTGDKREDWEISYQPSKEKWQTGKKEIQDGNAFFGFLKVLYGRAMYPDDSGNFEKRVGLANEKLGLPKEDFDASTKLAIKWATEKGQIGVQ